MKQILVAVMLCLAAPWLAGARAMAGCDRPDELGVYFASGNCWDNYSCTRGCEALVAFDIYFVLVNPSGPVLGFEFSYLINPPMPLARLANEIPGSGPIDIGDSRDPLGGFYMCGLVQPRVVSGNMVTLVHWTVMFTEFWPHRGEIYLGPIRFPSLPGGLPVIEGGEGWGLRRAEVARLWDGGPPNSPVAILNECAPLPVESNSFGSVKSLFR